MAVKQPKQAFSAPLWPEREYAIEWEAVDASDDAEPAATDPLGLTPADRAALGMSPPDSVSRETDEDAGRVLMRVLR